MTREDQPKNTRTVRGSVYSPAVALSEEKDIIMNWKLEK